MPNKCPLCKSSSTVFYKRNRHLYHQCNTCRGIFVDAGLILDAKCEQERYEQHNNDVEDIRYQKFVSPITSSIIRDFSLDHKGLDFGAGTGSAVSKVLIDNKFNIQQYDPFFHKNRRLLDDRYNYIASCEVIEHFNNPDKEFLLLNRLLLPQGKLYCMTDIYDSSIDFSVWYYKNDNTHIFIYQKETIYWIKENYGFSDVVIEGRLITFSA